MSLALGKCITVLYYMTVCTVWWRHSHKLTLIWSIKSCLGFKSQTWLHFLSGIGSLPLLDSSVSYSCAYSVGLSDISAVKQIREESELSVRRKPPFQICNQAKQQTTQTLRQSVSDFSQAFLQSITFYCRESTKKYCRMCCSEQLPPTDIQHIYTLCIAGDSNVEWLHISMLDRSLCVYCVIYMCVIFN